MTAFTLGRASMRYTVHLVPQACLMDDTSFSSCSERSLNRPVAITESERARVSDSKLHANQQPTEQHTGFWLAAPHDDGPALLVAPRRHRNSALAAELLHLLDLLITYRGRHHQ